jgi:hypothetical protein
MPKTALIARFLLLLCSSCGESGGFTPPTLEQRSPGRPAKVYNTESGHK